MKESKKMNISAIGKTLDQPLLISKLKDKTPKILTGLAAAYGVYDTMKAPKKERKKRGIKNAIILSSVVATSLTCAFGLKVGKKQIFKGLVDVKDQSVILKNQKEVIDKFLSQNNPNDRIKSVLNKAKTGLLNVSDTQTLLSEIKKADFKGGEELFDTLFSKKHDLSAKEIAQETGRLSVLGLMPVVAGVASGIAADKATNESSPRSSSNKIKEGAYQFLANIFMCNIGAAAALFGAERLQKAGFIKSLPPIKKLAVIMGGIFVTGIMGGSYVANFIGKKILDPVFDKKSDCEPKKRCLVSEQHQHPAPRPSEADFGSPALSLAAHPYFAAHPYPVLHGQNTVQQLFFAHRLPPKGTLAPAESDENVENSFSAHRLRHAKKGHCSLERKPELLDMALHTDDIATAGVLSGFRWIEPMLPLMYTISGYRAGIGYRNNKD